MTPKRSSSHADSQRLRDFEKHTKKAKDAFGNLDYLDKIPDPPRRGRIIFPYGDNGKPLPWGSGGWK